ncbi:hypothetical protein PG985_007763 [Apiospora marii]|uniref:uncharacterized protein n=1 Tax=Apiospora marii TaxID=335849 RepID=UPI00313256E1
MTTAKNANVPLLNLPVELLALIASEANGCGVLVRMTLRRTCRALRAAVSPPTLAELADLEAHWDVAEKLDLYACCRCRSLRPREAFSFFMLHQFSRPAWPDTNCDRYLKRRFCFDCADALAREQNRVTGSRRLLTEGKGEWMHALGKRKPDSKPNCEPSVLSKTPKTKRQVLHV